MLLSGSVLGRPLSGVGASFGSEHSAHLRDAISRQSIKLRRETKSSDVDVDDLAEMKSPPAGTAPLGDPSRRFTYPAESSFADDSIFGSSMSSKYGPRSISVDNAHPKFPLLTVGRLPDGTVTATGGIVCSRSVRLLSDGNDDKHFTGEFS